MPRKRARARRTLDLAAALDEPRTPTDEVSERSGFEAFDEGFAAFELLHDRGLHLVSRHRVCGPDIRLLNL
jgi:hypothetical protein